MKIENNIGWCDETINAVTGCDKVSPGCKNCYAESGTRARVIRAQGIETWGPKGVRHPVNFEPVFRRLNKLCICDKCHTTHTHDMLEMGVEIKCGECRGGKLRRIRLFADSNSDWLDERWPIETLARFLDAIRLALNVDVILLTKRQNNFNERVGQVAFGNLNSPLLNWCRDWINGNPPQNVWLGVSVENQAMAEKRLPELLRIPAAVRFLSCEPLLEELTLKGDRSMCPIDDFDWVIVGGESGSNRRAIGVESITSVADQCIAARVPVYVKQDCAFKSGQQGRITDKYWALKQFPKL